MIRKFRDDWCWIWQQNQRWTLEGRHVREIEPLAARLPQLLNDSKAATVRFRVPVNRTLPFERRAVHGGKIGGRKSKRSSLLCGSRCIPCLNINTDGSTDFNHGQQFRLRPNKI